MHLFVVIAIQNIKNNFFLRVLELEMLVFVHHKLSIVNILRWLESKTWLRYISCDKHSKQRNSKNYSISLKWRYLPFNVKDIEQNKDIILFCVLYIFASLLIQIQSHQMNIPQMQQRLEQAQMQENILKSQLEVC